MIKYDQKLFGDQTFPQLDLFDHVWSPNISSVDRTLQHFSLTTFCCGFMASCEVGVAGPSDVPAGAASGFSQVPCTIDTGELVLSTVGGFSLQLQWKKRRLSQNST